MSVTCGFVISIGSTVGVSSKPGPRGFPAKELDEKVNVW